MKIPIIVTTTSVIHAMCHLLICHLSICDSVIPALRTTPTILEVNQSYLEFMFLTSNSGDRPSSYVVEIRREGAEDWQEVRVLSESESGNVTVNLQYDFQVSATYDVRVIPIFEYDGETYRGYGAQATFTVPIPPVGGTGGMSCFKECVISYLMLSDRLHLRVDPNNAVRD